MNNPKPLIFVVIPFDPDFDNIYYGLKDIAEDIEAIAERADDPIDTNRITDRILKKIESADLIVADITLPNANIFYEVGYAQALSKSVLFIARDLRSLPFDVKDYSVIPYGEKVTISKFVKDLSPIIRSALEKALTTSSLRQPLGDVIDSINHVEPRDDLFAHIINITLEDIARRSKQWASGTVRVGPIDALEKGIEIFRNLKSGGFATYLVQIDSYWKSNNEYAEECRKAARNLEVLIERVFILSYFDLLYNESLREHLMRDEEAGIRTFIAFSRQVESINKNAVQDFGIWDDQVLCLIDTATIHGKNDVTGCSFSKSDADLSLAREWRESIMTVARPATQVLSELDKLSTSQSLLLQSAERMATIASNSCSGSYLSSEGCAWYHSAWQYLRILDMVSTPERHTAFFRENIRKAVIDEGLSQVLLCGVADYGMLQQFVEALPTESLTHLSIFVVDICPTPLRLSEWLADKRQFTITPIKSDVLKMGSHWRHAFDLIITDAFLTRFEPKMKTSVVAEWYRVLSPGGIVLTTARQANGVQKEKVIASPEDIKGFVNRAREESQSNKWLSISPEDIANYAKRYAENIVSYPFPDTKNIETLFRNCGFKIEVLEVKSVKGEFHATSLYTRLRARKPTKTMQENAPMIWTP